MDDRGVDEGGEGMVFYICYYGKLSNERFEACGKESSEGKVQSRKIENNY